MRIQNLFIGVVLISIVSISAATFYANTIADYAIFSPPDKLAGVDTSFDNASANVARIQRNVTGTADSGLKKEIIKIPGLGTIFSGLQIGSTALRAMFASADVVNSVIVTILSNPYLTVDQTITALIFTLATVMIGMALVALVLNRRP